MHSQDVQKLRVFLFSFTNISKRKVRHNHPKSSVLLPKELLILITCKSPKIGKSKMCNRGHLVGGTIVNDLKLDQPPTSPASNEKEEEFFKVS